VPFQVHIMYIEIIKIIFLFQTYLLVPFLLHIYMKMKDLGINNDELLGTICIKLVK
jgi:hypothetical protein